MTTRDTIRDRFTVLTEQPADARKNGYYAVVQEDRGGAKPALVYDSHAEYGHAGMFPNASSARENGEQWVNAKIDQIERTEALRAQRSGDLPHRLKANAQAVAGLKDGRSKINKEIDRLKTEHDMLIEEAMNPVVIMDFQSSANVFSLRVAPSASEGNLPDDPDDRQQQLPGLTVVDGGDGDGDGDDDDDGDGEKADKAPKKRSNRSKKAGTAKKTAEKKKRGRKKKPEQAPPTPGLDPKAIADAWPEEDGEPQINRDHDEALAAAQEREAARKRGPRVLDGDGGNGDEDDGEDL